MSEKITGYLLLIIGLAVMIGSTVNMFMVFTNKAKPFSVFNISSSSLNLSDIISQFQKNNPSASPSASNQTIKPPKIDILPPEVLNQTLNLSTHFFFITFVLGFGYKLASLGIQLIRTINVRLKSHFLEVMNNEARDITNTPSFQPPTQSTPPQSTQPVEPVQPQQT